MSRSLTRSPERTNAWTDKIACRLGRTQPSTELAVHADERSNDRTHVRRCVRSMGRERDAEASPTASWGTGYHNSEADQGCDWEMGGTGARQGLDCRDDHTHILRWPGFRARAGAQLSVMILRRLATGRDH